MVNICAVCGRLVPEDEIFCPGCGTSIPQAERKNPLLKAERTDPPRQAEEVVVHTDPGLCAHCGRALRPGQFFCLYCGKPTPEKLRRRSDGPRKQGKQSGG